MENATGQLVGITSTPVLEAPKFTTQLVDVTNLKEGQSAHFEARVTPVNDPNLVVSLRVVIFNFVNVKLVALCFFIFIFLRSNGISTAKSYNTVIGSGRSTILAS